MVFQRERIEIVSMHDQVGCYLIAHRNPNVLTLRIAECLLKRFAIHLIGRRSTYWKAERSLARDKKIESAVDTKSMLMISVGDGRARSE